MDSVITLHSYNAVPILFRTATRNSVFGHQPSRLMSRLQNEMKRSDYNTYSVSNVKFT